MPLAPPAFDRRGGRQNPVAARLREESARMRLEVERMRDTLRRGNLAPDERRALELQILQHQEIIRAQETALRRFDAQGLQPPR
jgi:hypothetical protein